MRNLNELPEIVYKTVYKRFRLTSLLFGTLLLSVATPYILETLKEIFELIIFI